MKLSLLTLTLTLATCVGSLHAACSGGGFSKKPIADRLVVAPAEVAGEVVDLNETAQVMSVKAGPLAPIVAFDSARFTKATAALKLSDNQLTEMASAKSQIQKRLEALKTAYVNAQNELVQCQGRCDSAGKKLEAATRDLKQFDPNQAYADRLSHILNPDQFAQLEIKAKRQGI